METLESLRQERDRLRAQLKVMKEALQETLAALVSYKKYVPEPYKQNPIYIIGAHEAEVKAVAALSQLEGETEAKAIRGLKGAKP